MKNLILLSGNPNSGKDTVADILVDQGYNKLALADSLKRLASELFNLHINYFYDRDLKDLFLSALNKTYTPRELLHILTDLGFENDEVLLDIASRAKCSDPSFQKYFGNIQRGIPARKLNPHIFINPIIDQMEGYENVVVSDVRFKIESKVLEAFAVENRVKVLKVFVDRTGTKTEEPIIAAELADIRMYLTDHYLKNDFSLEVLKENVNEMLTEHGMKL